VFDGGFARIGAVLVQFLDVGWVNAESDAQCLGRMRISVRQYSVVEAGDLLLRFGTESLIQNIGPVTA
jgi:hypothetical protein